MRIVHTESSLGWGGQEIRILAEAQGLARRGHELMLLCPPEARIYARGAALRRASRGAADREKAAAPACARCGAGSRREPLRRGEHAQLDRFVARGARLRRWDSRSRSCARATSRRRCRATSLTRWLYTPGGAHRHDRRGAEARADRAHRRIRRRAIESVPTGIDPARFQPGDQQPARSDARPAAGGDAHRHRRHAAQLEGPPYLMEAMAHCPRARRWSIVGDGPQREALERAGRERSASPIACASRATSATWCRGCRRSTSSRCLPMPTKACRRR